MSTSAWGLGVEWEQDPHDAVTFRRRGAIVTYDDERHEWLAQGPGTSTHGFAQLAQALAWADLLVEPEQLPESAAPPPADPAALVNAIRAVLDDPMLDDTGVVRAIEAVLRVAP